MGYTVDQIQDLLATTLRDLPKGEFEAMWDYQNYTFAHIYAEHNREIDGGTSIQRNVILDETGDAKYRTLFDTDQPMVNQAQFVVNVPWVQLGTNYSWDEVEILTNKNDEKGFIRLLESRRTTSLWSYANLFEQKGWATPVNAADTKNPFGIPYYITFANSGVDVGGGGFVGQTIRYQDGSTGTVCAGLDAASLPKWRNYADIYKRVDNALLRTLRSAVRRTRFNPAPIMPKPGNDKVGPGITLYAADDVCSQLEDLSDKRDDASAPGDLAGKMLYNRDGVSHFNKMPVEYAPLLDGFTVGSSTPNPLFCIDWSKLQPVTFDGYWMKEGKPMVDRGQHTTYTVYLDSRHNNLCINRRTAGFVIHNKMSS
jgi:hypothetical protein